MAINVREAGKEDAEIISEWLNDERVRKYLTSNLRQGEMSAGLVRAAFRRPDQRWFVFSVDDEPVGIVALDHIDEVDGLANIWYFLGSQNHLRKGYVTAAISHVMETNLLSLHSATAWTGEPNKASQRCLEKAGFRKVGEYKDAFVVDGTRSNRILFERTFGPQPK